MVRRGILRGHPTDQSRRAVAAPPGGGGVLCKHVRVHDYLRALPEHPSGVAVPVGPMLGLAGPGLPSGGGGGCDVLAALGVQSRRCAPRPPRPYGARLRVSRPALPPPSRAAGPAALWPALLAQPPPPFAPPVP